MISTTRKHSVVPKSSSSRGFFELACSSSLQLERSNKSSAVCPLYISLLPLLNESSSSIIASYKRNYERRDVRFGLYRTQQPNKSHLRPTTARRGISSVRRTYSTDRSQSSASQARLNSQTTFYTMANGYVRPPMHNPHATFNPRNPRRPLELMGFFPPSVPIPQEERPNSAFCLFPSSNKAGGGTSRAPGQLSPEQIFRLDSSARMGMSRPGDAPRWNQRVVISILMTIEDFNTGLIQIIRHLFDWARSATTAVSSQTVAATRSSSALLSRTLFSLSQPQIYLRNEDFTWTQLLTDVWVHNSWSIFIGLAVVVVMSVAAWFLSPKGENQTYVTFASHPLFTA